MINSRAKLVKLLVTLIALSSSIFQSFYASAAPIETRSFLTGYKPVILLNTAQETIACNEAANTNQLEIEAANAAQTANTYDNEAATTFLFNKRNLLPGYKPVILFNTAQETIACNEAANTNQLEIEAANAAQTANTYDNEAATTLLFNKRSFLTGYKPVVLLNTAHETIASNEAANVNQLEIEAANAAQTANTYDNEAAATLLVNKRNFLGQYKPVILLNSAQETIASNEAANVNQLEIEAANAAQTACSYDNEAATTFLFNKRNFLTGYKPVVLLNTAHETIACNEAANTNQLEIEAANAAQTANTYDNEAAATLLVN
ncbi:hypothetical protein G9A89_021454 [Geosiphon pyriformis]|nr:hypothetical protein G9A89_021452 [Geosiphon pyriformis]KAG9304674.1 hypothetical protein G9A89_021454 [Geosiphon pyriformis]